MVKMNLSPWKPVKCAILDIAALLIFLFRSFNRTNWKEERRLNMETFGIPVASHRGFRSLSGGGGGDSRGSWGTAFPRRYSHNRPESSSKGRKRLHTCSCYVLTSSCPYYKISMIH